MFKDILAKWKIIGHCKINNSDFRITFPNGSEIIFMGLDDETKLLSLNNIGTIFVEEVYEVTQDIVEQLNLRMRGNTKNQQIIMAWNPISKASWLYDFCEVNSPESFEYIHSTFRDNPFLPDEYVKSLEEMYIRNPQKARVFCDGQWGVPCEGLVFKNWKVEDFDEMKLAELKYERRTGADLGFIDPTTIVDSLYDKENRTIYVFNEFYKTGQQLDDICKALDKMGLRRQKVFFDSAEPRTIQYFRSMGFNARECIKGQGSVEARISFLQNHTIIVKPTCKNLINELENFSYIKDKKTGQYTESTTHEFSHAIDGLGYAYSDIYAKGKAKALDIGKLFGY